MATDRSWEMRVPTEGAAQVTDSSRSLPLERKREEMRAMMCKVYSGYSSVPSRVNLVSSSSLYSWSRINQSRNQ